MSRVPLRMKGPSSQTCLPRWKFFVFRKLSGCKTKESPQKSLAGQQITQTEGFAFSPSLSLGVTVYLSFGMEQSPDDTFQATSNMSEDQAWFEEWTLTVSNFTPYVSDKINGEVKCDP
ncbi:hypothetical protein CEXT_591421 [Caerostris extrusa]|uniref:Uncharacterized protein n=1 Tax=Caerostris extrusa TaxID=172846 RepID=A0AAV4TPB9_CAEEX|nr:hypothetical protein CEXT_591421 [Caerostris extrusa]